MSLPCNGGSALLQQVGPRAFRLRVDADADAGAHVSNRQLLRSNFLRTVHYLLHLAKMPPSSLEIEVTESMFVEGGKAGSKP